MPRTTPVPTSADELLAALEDPNSEVLRDPAGFAQWVSNYARAAVTRDENLADQVRTHVEASMRELLAGGDDDVAARRLTSTVSKVVSTPGATLSALKAAGYCQEAPGAHLDRDGKPWTLAEFAHAAYHRPTRHGIETRERYTRVMADYSGTIPSSGALLIPETLRTDIMMGTLEQARVRPRATVVPMLTPRLTYPAVDDASHAGGTVYGGIDVQWVAEGETPTASQGTFGAVVLDARKLMARAAVPNELISDALPAFQTFLETAYPAAMAWGEDSAFITGSGVGRPLGAIAPHPARIVVPKRSAQTADTVVWENVIDMYSRMLPSGLSRAVWLYSPDVFPELATMALSVGTGGSAAWLGSGVGAPPVTILGLPAYPSEHMAKLGDQGDIALIDFSSYAIGDRQSMTMDSSPHEEFSSDRTVYRIIAREDGRPLLLSPLTPANSGATLSAFVTLAERA